MRRLVAVGLFALTAMLGTAPTATAHREPDPVPSRSPAPKAAVAVQAADIAVGPDYWQGTTAPYRLTVTVTNTGVPAVVTTTTVTLPPRLRHIGAETGACTGADLSFECRLDGHPGRNASATITILVAVAPDAWREPAGGSVRTTAVAVDSGSTDTHEDPFTVLFPPGPPTPGIDLTAETVGAVATIGATGGAERTDLVVRLRNTGPVQAAGGVEVLAPPGVQVATMPALCVERTRISQSREHCGLGRVAAGQDLVLKFTLMITPRARGEALGTPLSGSVQGSLTPSGQDTVTVQATYQIRVADQPAPSDGPTGPVTVPLGDAAQPQGLDLNQRQTRSVSPVVSPFLSVLPVTTAIFGLFATLTAMVILSLRGTGDHSSRQPDVLSK